MRRSLIQSICWVGQLIFWFEYCRRGRRIAQPGRRMLWGEARKCPSVEDAPTALGVTGVPGASMLTVTLSWLCSGGEGTQPPERSAEHWPGWASPSDTIGAFTPSSVAFACIRSGLA